MGLKGLAITRMTELLVVRLVISKWLILNELANVMEADMTKFDVKYSVNGPFELNVNVKLAG